MRRTQPRVVWSDRVPGTGRHSANPELQGSWVSGLKNTGLVSPAGLKLPSEKAHQAPISTLFFFSPLGL